MRNQNRQIKYHFILNLTGDVKLARRGRDWSLKRIEQVFGVSTSRSYYNKDVTILEKPPKRVELTKRQLENRRRRFDSGGVQIPPIVTGVTFVPPQIPYQRPVLKDYNKVDRKTIRREERSKDERDNWAWWASIEEYPAHIVRLAEIANRRGNKQKDDSFGWAVVYNMYVLNMTMDDVLRHMSPNPFINDFYEDNLRHLHDAPRKRK